MMGNKIGKGVKLSFGSVILSKRVEIGDNVKISPFSIVQAEKVSIHQGATIGSFCFFELKYLSIGKKTRIRESVMVGGNKSPDSELIVGDNCLILQNTLLNTTDKIDIGNNTAIGGGSKLFTHSSWLSILEGYPVQQGRIKIGSNVWIPYDTTILSGVSIGDHVIITPRSIVNRDVPSESIAGGVPFKISKNFYHRDLAVQKKEQILGKIMSIFIEYLEFDGFERIFDQKNAKIFSMERKHIGIVKDLKTLSNIEDQLSVKNKKIGVFLTDVCSEYLDESLRTPVVYLKENHPVVLNSNDITDLILVFLSRYGIR